MKLSLKRDDRKLLTKIYAKARKTVYNKRFVVKGGMLIAVNLLNFVCLPLQSDVPDGEYVLKEKSEIEPSEKVLSNIIRDKDLRNRTWFDCSTRYGFYRVYKLNPEEIAEQTELVL